MSNSSGFQAVPGWYWPEDLPREPRTASSGSPSQERPAQPSPQTSSSAGPSSQEGQNTGPRRKHWPPRQCRICFETVQPTFNVPAENLPNFLQSTPHVVYEDEGGRLIRPCQCKGSSKYVHDNCLQAWRHADPSYGRRNYFQCPTCGFKYRLARLGYGRIIASTEAKAAQITLTLLILILTIFFLGFVADPIINMYLDPWSYVMPWSSSGYYDYYEDDEPATWYAHFAKGFASMGVLGFLKVLLASPFSYFRIGGGRGRATGRDRYEQISWIIIAIGVGTFLVAIWKGVRAWSRRTLEKAGERVMDVPGDGDDEDDEGYDETTASSGAT
ncbi:hypothetical protein EJ04DRAFT_592778 [Polyplosphaeria fusca]|uniref:RING-CH-type domain-containing protein n=1 Tax=Polyplosphaeria fusca TaxID=682080 RepID=A0A9P4V7N4_9PLEO|nr:hypothetical protein EJ04DRAFT_592778 [Polyplosphaeria fusca]